MKKHMRSLLTVILLIAAMLMTSCITIVVPTDTPESVVPENTTEAVTTKASETEPPTEKTDAPETKEPVTSEPVTEPPTEAPTEPPTEAPTEPASPPEAKTFDTLPVLVLSHGKNDWDASVRRNKYWVSWPQFSVLGQEWPEFAKAIEKWNAAADRQGLTLYTDNLEDARKSFDPNMNNWDDTTKALVQRADEKIFSVLLEQGIYHGGAHPGTAYSALNMDPKTGKELGLSDIVQDADVFTEKALALLEKQNKDNGSTFSGSYKTTFKELLQKELKGEDASGFAWVLLGDRLRMVVDEYIIAPYAYGPVYVDVPFYEDETLYLDGDYYTASEGSFWAFEKDQNNNYNTRLREEGPNGQRIITVMDWPGDYYGEYELYVGELAGKRNRGLGFTGVYMHEKDGKYHAYIGYYYENEYCMIDVYEVTENSFTLLDTVGGEILPLKNDPAYLYLKMNGDALGTWTGYSKMTLQGDGTLRSDGLFMFDNKDDSFYGGKKRTLTTKMEVRAFSVEDPNKEVKIPEGTVLIPYESDFESFLDVILPDGSFARIRYERVNYNYVIDGVSQYDVFDGIMYAG